MSSPSLPAALIWVVEPIVYQPNQEIITDQYLYVSNRVRHLNQARMALGSLMYLGLVQMSHAVRNVQILVYNYLLVGLINNRLDDPN